MPNLELYGQDHSPWVQAVLLGVHDKSISHTLRTAPPLAVFAKWGVIMPAASVDGEPWQLESTDILQRIGYGTVSVEDLHAVNGAWRGVLHRPDSAFRFFHGFSLAGDSNTSSMLRLRNNFLRSFATLYFFLLIRFSVLIAKNPDPENFGDQFLFWEEKLTHGDGAFLGGASPDTIDFLLFGIIQCHCSIPVPPIQALQQDPRLIRVRGWIAAMQERFSDYEHLYSGVYFEPHSPPPVPASVFERTIFWLGSAVMILSFPVTVPLIAFLVLRVQKG